MAAGPEFSRPDAFGKKSSGPDPDPAGRVPAGGAAAGAAAAGAAAAGAAAAGAAAGAAAAGGAVEPPSAADADNDGAEPEVAPGSTSLGAGSFNEFVAGVSAEAGAISRVSSGPDVAGAAGGALAGGAAGTAGAAGAAGTVGRWTAVAFFSR